MDTQEARQKIKSAAYASFREVGYAKTSYSLLAEKSGCGRPLVQYHFPKKEDLLVEFMDDVMVSVAGQLEKRGVNESVQPGYALAFWQVCFELLLLDGGTRALAADMLSSRAVAMLVAAKAREITLAAPDEEADASRAVYASILATGSVFDLLYLGLSGNGALDAGDLACTEVALYLSIYQDTTFSELFSELKDIQLFAQLARKIAAKALSDVVV